MNFKRVKIANFFFFIFLFLFLSLAKNSFALDCPAGVDCISGTICTPIERRGDSCDLGEGLTGYCCDVPASTPTPGCPAGLYCVSGSVCIHPGDEDPESCTIPGTTFTGMCCQNTPTNTPTPVRSPGGDDDFSITDPFAGCPNETDYINTALGCIPIVNTNSFINWFFSNLVGIAGGIALLLMIFGAFQIITSGGNPDKVKQGQSFVISAISGLLFMIFSLFLLRFIGVGLLGLPGLN